MFNNPQSLPNKYECAKETANLLIYEHHLPLFSLDRKTGKHYFAITPNLRRVLNEIPRMYKFFHGIKEIR